MRGEEIESQSEPWVYRPASHKGSWRERDREILLGPQSISVLASWIRPRGPLFGYRESSYYNAIRRTCRRLDVPHWTPNQLRHAAATRIRRECGIEVARTLLGHTDISTTEIYAERDAAAARAAAMAHG